MPKRRPSRSAGVVNLGHDPGQFCPFVWSWFKCERDLDIAVDLQPAYELLGDWFTLFCRLNPGAPTPRGIERRPDLAVKLLLARSAARAT